MAMLGSMCLAGAALSMLLPAGALAASAGPGTVTDRTFLGSAVRLEVALDTGEKVLVESSSLHAQLKHGDRIAMRILADSVVVAQRNEP